MAETPLKRQREETLAVEEDPKRVKPFTQILSILEEEEEEPNQDFSSILTTLERELSFGSEPDKDLYNPTPSSIDEEDKESDKVMRLLLEASDDELGLPNRTDGGDDETVFNGGDESGLSVCDGLWELEDEAANYYTLLQSELFM